MTKEEMDIDRYYDSLYSKYQEEAKVSFSDYRKLEEKYEILENKIKGLIEYIQNNDIAGAYEYAVSEGLV